MTAEIRTESVHIPVDSTDTLHLKRFFLRVGGPPVFMMHGSVENGRVFYPRSGNGLAPYLARKGFDVFVGDLRGRGESEPRINRNSSYGQTEAITEDITAFVERIREISGSFPRHWIAHSWGGVLLLSHFARFPDTNGSVDSMVFLGTKRRISVWNLKRLIMIDVAWCIVARLLVRLFGFLPRGAFGRGMDAETNKSHLQCKRWVRESKWIDSDDDFNYREALRSIKLPRSFWLAGSADSYLGHPDDVIRFREEALATNGEYLLLGRTSGCSRDYGHVDMLTHPAASKDHFPMILDWLRDSPRRVRGAGGTQG